MPGSRGIALGFLLSFILLVPIFSHFVAGNEAITVWDRTIGPATLAGIDIQKRTGHFSSLIIFWIPLVAIFFSLVCSKLSTKFPKLANLKFPQVKLPVQAFVFYFAVAFSAIFLIVPFPALSLAPVPLAVHGIFFAATFSIAFFATKKTNLYESVISTLFGESTVVIPVLLFIAVSAYTSDYLIPFLATKSDLYSQVLGTSITDTSLSCVMLALGSFLLNSILDIHKKCPLKTPIEYLCIFLCTSLSLTCFTGVDIHFTSLIAFAFFTIITLYFIRKPIPSQVNLCCDLSKGLVWIPAIIAISLEAIFILAEKGLSLPLPWVIILVICALFLFLQRKLPASIYLGTIISLGAVAFLGHTYQQVWDFKDYAYLYEMGNKTVALGTFLHGQLPIIDYFSAHAIFDVWTQILHAIVSPGIEGILADPYGGLNDLLALVILYFILKKFVSPAAAILFIVLFPFNALGIKAYNICFAAILAHYAMQKNFTVKWSILFWVIIAANAFFLYDDGVSLGVAAIAATCIMFICKRDKISLAKFIGIGCAVGASLAVIACIICAIKGIAPISRFKEWMDLTLKSSAIWATASIGDPHSPAFLSAYFIAPATASFAFYYTAYKSIRNKNLSIIAATTIIFAVAELLFIPRGIIFHNLTENNGIAGRLLNFWPWTISCFALFLLEERKILQVTKDWCWIFVFGASLFVSAGAVTRYLPNANNQLANTSVSAAAQFHPSEKETLQGPRITYSQNTNAFLNTFRRALDSVLTPSETFLDFSNSTALYAMLGRAQPAYVAQMPGLLSTVYTQQQFIEQMKKEAAPIAIIGNADIPYLREMTWEPHNIPHNIRYYLVAEYIYENYKPYKVIGDYALWCKKDRCEEQLPYTYDVPIKSTHHYYLYKLPYVWAHNDALNASAGPIINVNEPSDVKQARYLKLTIYNNVGKETDALLTLVDLEAQTRARFEFTVVPGTDQYLFRISADSHWHGHNMSDVSLSGYGVTLEKAEFLGGE